MYINLYMNHRFCIYTLHRRQDHFFVIHLRIFFFNLYKDLEYFKFLGTEFQIWAPKETTVSVPHTEKYLHFYAAGAYLFENYIDGF